MMHKQIGTSIIKSRALSSPSGTCFSEDFPLEVLRKCPWVHRSCSNGTYLVSALVLILPVKRPSVSFRFTSTRADISPAFITFSFETESPIYMLGDN